MIDMTKSFRDYRIEEAMGVGNDFDTDRTETTHEPVLIGMPSDVRIFTHSNAKGSGVTFGMAASSAFNRSALEPLIG